MHVGPDRQLLKSAQRKPHQSHETVNEQPVQDGLGSVARAAQCAADQGKFWDYRRNLLEAPGDWTDEDLLRRTASLGLDRAGLQACLWPALRASRTDPVIALRQE